MPREGLSEVKGPVQRLVAPILHSLVLCVLVVIPAGLAKWSIIAFHLKPPLSLARSLILTILMQWLIFAFMWTGITIRGHNLRDLLGRGWQNLPDIKMDVMLAPLLASLHISIALLVGLLGPFNSFQGDNEPKTISELLLALFLAVSAGFAEEFIFRGYFQRQMTTVFRSEKWGLISQAILFAIAHGFHQTLPGFLAKFLSGCLFGWFAMRRNSLLPGLIAHCGVNFVATVLLFWWPQAS